MKSFGFIFMTCFIACPTFAHKMDAKKGDEVEKRFFQVLQSHFDEFKKMLVCRSFSDVEREVGAQTTKECTYGKHQRIKPATCEGQLDLEVLTEIETYRRKVRRILEAILNEDSMFKHNLGQQINTFISRPEPKAVDSAIDYFKNGMVSAGLENIQEQRVSVNHQASALWQINLRKSGSPIVDPNTGETLVNISARPMSNSLDPCISRDWSSNSSEIILLETLEDIEKQKDNLKDKVVFLSSEVGREIRDGFFAPGRAAKYGATAIFISDPDFGGSRSALENIEAQLDKLDAELDYTYGDYLGSATPPGIKLVRSQALILSHLPKIPTAFIRSDVLAGLGALKKRDGIQVEISCTTHPNLNERVNAKNLLGDFGGSKKNAKNQEYVLWMSRSDPLAYIDPPKGKERQEVDGAHTQALGVFMGLQMVALYKHLNLSTERVLRTGIFTGTDMNRAGILKWVGQSKESLTKHGYTAALQASLGCYKPSGLIVSGNGYTGCIIKEIKKMVFEEMEKLTKVKYTAYLSKIDALPGDMLKLQEKGVPVITLNGDKAGQYFEGYYYGRNEDDLIDVDNFQEVDECLAVMASTTYILANVGFNIRSNANVEISTTTSKPGKLKKMFKKHEPPKSEGILGIPSTKDAILSIFKQ